MAGTRQTRNRVGGDIVGRDKTSTVQIGSVPATFALRRLVEKLAEEQKNDIRAKEIIAELKRYQVPLDPVPISLEQKLKDGHREDIVIFATEAKEQFAKKLAKNTFFESAQEIHALLLSKIYCVFKAQVLPQIQQGADRLAVDRLVQTLIIDPIVVELQETPFRYYDEHVHGMLYYLTGNCYIVWK